MKLFQQVAPLAVAQASPRSKMTAFLMALGATLPTSAFASEGEDVRLRFTGLDQTLLWVAVGLGVLAIIYAFLLAKSVTAESPGDESMQSVGQAIKDGAVAYLKQQVKTMVGFVILLGIGLGVLYAQYGVGTAAGVALCFLFGVVGSYVAGSTGMVVAVNGNMRTANAAITSYKKALEIAFRSGAVAGLLTVGIGLVGASLILLLGGERATMMLVGFGFGGSLAALFMRVGGGIFTKAADVGADLVGKVEAGIPEDDPRNPAVIADNVGDNVGDCAGMAADVFESYIVILIAAIVLAAATAAVVDPSTWIRLVVFAMVAAGIGIIASVIGIATVRGSDDLDSDPLKPIRGGFVRSAVIAGALTLVAAFFLTGGQKPLTTSRLESVEQAYVDEITNYRSIRDEMVKKTVTEAQVRQAREEKAKELNKLPDAVTAQELVLNAEKTPEVLKGVSEAEIRRVLEKRTDPIQPYEITAQDLLRVTFSKNRVVSPREQSAAQSAISGNSSDLPRVPSLAGYDYVADLASKDYPGLDYAVQPPPTSPSYNPSKPYIPVRDYFKDEKDNPLIVAKVKIQAKFPKEQNTTQFLPQEDVDREIVQGPIRQKELDDQVKKARESAKEQGIDATIDVLDSYPVRLYANREGDLAMGVVGAVERPYQLQDPQNTLAYFPQTADQLNAADERARSAGQPTARPAPKELRIGVVDQTPIQWWRFAAAVLFGLALAFVIERLTDYYVATNRKPTQEVAGVSSGGAAPMLISGFAYGLESAAMMVLAILAAILGPLFLFPPSEFGGYTMALYGVALVGLGLLTTTGYVLAMDTFGPISDNSQGVFEMSGKAEAHPEGAKAVGRLDAAGNTTKALTKGFAIATAVVAAIALFNSYRGAAKLTDIGMKLDVPEIFLGLLVGGAAPFLFSAFAINAVGRSSFQLINEVRRQFREKPGIMLGTDKPDYGRCVEIVTAAAQKELLAPGILAIFLPAAVAFGFSIGKETTVINGTEYNLVGAQALGGYLAGAILTGLLMAVLLANSGGMWDNAKKLIEDGLYGGKGTDAHKASVICDTVGDPFKDTAGPALNPLIKVMNLVALLLVPVVIQPHSNVVLIVITAACLAVILFSFWLSKKGSLSEELQRAQTAGATAASHFESASLPTESASSSTVASDDAPKAKRRITVEDDDEN